METHKGQTTPALTNAFASLKSLSWWRQTSGVVWRLAPRFLPCAITMTVANVIGVLSMGSIAPMLAGVDTASAMVIQAAFWCVIGLLLSVVLSLWALTSWLFRLTAFSRACIAHEVSPTILQFDAAAAELKKKAGYLARVWLVASAYLTVPVVPMAVLIGLKMVSTAGILEKIGMPALVIPAWADALLILAIIMLGIFTAAYTFMLLVMSSTLSRTAVDANHEAIVLCVKKWRPVLWITALVLTINILLSAPESIDADLSQKAVLLQMAVQFWMGAVSLVTWPLTIAPYCLIVSAHRAAARNKVK